MRAAQASLAQPGTIAPALTKVSLGQAAVVPSQFSARSHAPLAARQVTVAGCTPSAGHAKLVPSQVSARSQAPAAGRHGVPTGSALAGHCAIRPSHCALPEQAPLAHTVP